MIRTEGGGSYNQDRGRRTWDGVAHSQQLHHLAVRSWVFGISLRVLELPATVLIYWPVAHPACLTLVREGGLTGWL